MKLLIAQRHCAAAIKDSRERSLGDIARFNLFYLFSASVRSFLLLQRDFMLVKGLFNTVARSFFSPGHSHLIRDVERRLCARSESNT